MKIFYSDHVLKRTAERRVPYDLPGRIFNTAEERFFDHKEKSLIAVMEVEFGGKTREMMIAYVYDGDDVIIKTTHQLQKNEKRNRIANGRWEKIK